MRTSSNPAFRNLPTSPGGYARFGDGPAGMGPAGAAGMGGMGGMGTGSPMPATGAADRPITVDDVVQKTAINAAVTLGVGVLTAISGFYALALVGIIVGFVLSLVIAFKQSTNKALILSYSAAMGMGLGGVTGFLQSVGGENGPYAGIGVQAVIATFGVFIGMLVVYKTGAVRVTPRLYKMVFGALIGAVVLMLVNFIAGIFIEGGLGLRDGGPLAILFSIAMIALGAFMLMLDFDQADQAVKAGVPARFAWFLAFGFMTSLVWIYIEILRLLSYFRE